MRCSYNVSLMLLLLYASGLAAIQPGEQKWATAARMGAPVTIIPVVTTPNGIIYTGTDKQLWAISKQGAKQEMVHQFSDALPETVAIALSTDRKSLYVTYTSTQRQNPQQIFGRFDTFDLAQPNPAEPAKSMNPEKNSKFSAPTVDTAGAVYIESIPYAWSWSGGANRPKLIKISDDNNLSQEIKFTPTIAPLSLRKNVGPAIYNGGAAIVSECEKKPYLFYASFKNTSSQSSMIRSCQNDKGWSSLLLPETNYSVPAIDNNPDSPTKGTVYLGNSLGELEAYRGKVADYGSKNSTGATKTDRNGVKNGEDLHKWSKQISADLSASTPVVAANGMVYIGDSGTGILYGVNLEKGESWSSDSLSHYSVTKAPVVDDKNGLAYVVDDRNNLFAVDISLTHSDHFTCLWQQKGIGANTAPVLEADGTVLVGTIGGQVIAYQGGHFSASQLKRMAPC